MMRGAVPPVVKLAARKAVAGYMLWRVRRRSVTMKACEPGRVTLVFAPHQDDCALGCGGLISSRAAAGNPVHIAYLTDGAASHRGHPTVAPSALARLRSDEARTSASILGVPSGNLTFLEAPDGELPRLPGEVRAVLVQRAAALISGLGAADVLVTAFEDGSSEHAAANLMVREAASLAKVAKSRVLEYPIWSIWSPLRLKGQIRKAARVERLALSSHLLERKKAAIRAFRSQVLPLEAWGEAALPPGFIDFFGRPEEFFFEY